jgi:hypothetical protein
MDHHPWVIVFPLAVNKYKKEESYPGKVKEPPPHNTSFSSFT